MIAGGPGGARAFLGLGSNLGDRLENLRRAVLLLDAFEGVRFRRSSRVYESDPVGPPQPDYLNAVVEVETTLSPRGLLERCRDVEAAMGRVRAERWGARVIDVDVLTYGREEVAEADLEIPHPRMHERAFVLLPLTELDADPPLPGGRRLASLRLEGAGAWGARPYAPALEVGGETDEPPRGAGPPRG